MKKILFALAIAATGFLTSCGNITEEAAETVDTTVVETPTVDTIVAVEVDTTATTTDTATAE